ncbi:VOC family protein [Patulibacter minatonensis]|uniref:VOC family protein n=1 Tax=Patulibacter minatonensis TaxID=298163 RepID=UPI00047AC3EB|nr:VOC family protein [Patulibacter minatonensis]
MTSPALHLTGVATMVVPVSDQDRALAFYAGVLGFRATIDFTYDTGERWLEVSPPDGGTRLTLAAAEPAGLIGAETGVILASSDVPADHAALEAAGADVDPALLMSGEVVRWASAPLAGHPAQFRLRDPDGNGLLVVSDH